MATNRHREVNGRIATDFRIVESFSNAPSNTYIYPNSVGAGTLQSCDDVANSGFKRNQKSGICTFNDCSIVSYSRSYTGASLSTGPYGSNSYRVTMSGDLAGIVEAVAPGYGNLDSDIEKMRAVALVEAYAKIRGNSVMSGEILSDFGRTINSLRHPFRNASQLLHEAWKSAKKSYGKTARSVARANASAWLEYRYGLRPTLSDINQIAQNAHSFRDRMERRRLVVRSGVSQSKKFTKTFTDLAIPVWGMRVSGSVNSSHDVKVNGGVMYEVAHRTSSEQMSEDFQLGADSLPSTLWEIMPYSFVVDWFVNVGGWIEAMNLPPSTTVVGSWTSLVNNISIDYQSTDLYLPVTYPPGGKHGTFGSSSHKLTQLHRKCNQQLPTTPLPKVSFASVTHAVDAAALSLDPVLRALGKLKH